MSKTIGQELKERYENFLKEAKQIVGDKIVFPSLEEIDIEDLFMLLEMCFPNDNTNVNLLAVLRIRDVQLNEEQFEKMVSLVNDVLIFIKSVRQ